MAEYENTKVKGDLAEVEVFRYLKTHGYTVSIPFGENAPYDLVVESPAGKMYRLQVRWGSWRNDVLEISLRIVSKNYYRTINLDRIEAFVAWDGEHVYIIPKDQLAGLRAAIRLRRTPPKNNQKKGVRMASEYKNNIKLLP